MPARTALALGPDLRNARRAALPPRPERVGGSETLEISVIARSGP
jgi:hypothetical protein